MVALYADGKRLGEWPEDAASFLEAVRSGKVEFRDNAGKVVAQVAPPKEPIIPWDPTVTREQIDREIAEGGGMTLAEFWKKMGVE